MLQQLMSEPFPTSGVESVYEPVAPLGDHVHSRAGLGCALCHVAVQQHFANTVHAVA
jgi:hypothetical protein